MIALHGNSLTYQSRQLVISFEPCRNSFNCKSERQISEWIKGKQFALLYNQISLNAKAQPAEDNLRMETVAGIGQFLRDVLQLDQMRGSQSLREQIEKRAHYKQIPLAPGMHSETVLQLRNTKFDKQDNIWQPDRSQNSYDCNERLFEFIEQPNRLTYPDDAATQQIIFERDLDLTMLRRVGPSFYTMVGTVGGLLVVLFLVGQILVSCLTINAYEDHLVQTLYPTKDILKDRIKNYMAQFPPEERAKFSHLIKPDEESEKDDMLEPNLDMTRFGILRCFCRCLFSKNCFCMAFKRCARNFCCKQCAQTRAEEMFDVGREFYTNEISVSRLVKSMQHLEFKFDKEY